MKRDEQKLYYWKAFLEYDGTRYSGWQEQPNAKTIAGTLREEAAKILGKDVEVDGAGRTDAGVHALAQVARIRTKKFLPPETTLYRLNAILPKDINILSIAEASPSFHPRHDASVRYYLYQISLRRTAFAKRFVWWLQEDVDWKIMRRIASGLIGRHDFARFADKRSNEPSSIVVVETAEVDRQGDLILFRIGASHYLWKMVRRIVGCLVLAGQNKISEADFDAFLSPHPLPGSLRSFSIAAHTAPASGLFLERVLYESDVPIGPLKPAFPV